MSLEAIIIELQSVFLGTTDIERRALKALQKASIQKFKSAKSTPLPAEIVTVMEEEQFDAVLVTNYLWRPLWPLILGSIRDKGFLIYETFMLGNEAYGKPSNPDFLLQPGELLEVCRDMSILAFEQGLLTEPKRCVQRIVAKRNDLAAADPWPTLDSLK